MSTVTVYNWCISGCSLVVEDVLSSVESVVNRSMVA